MRYPDWPDTARLLYARVSYAGLQTTLPLYFQRSELYELDEKKRELKLFGTTNRAQGKFPVFADVSSFSIYDGTGNVLAQCLVEDTMTTETLVSRFSSLVKEYMALESPGTSEPGKTRYYVSADFSDGTSRVITVEDSSKGIVEYDPEAKTLFLFKKETPGYASADSLLLENVEGYVVKNSQGATIASGRSGSLFR